MYIVKFVNFTNPNLTKRSKSIVFKMYILLESVL